MYLPRPLYNVLIKIGKRTEKLQFDWDNAEGALGKVEEEFAELREALDEDHREHIEHELGDVLFSLAQLGRHLQMEPEQILRRANHRFETRFKKMMELAQAENVNWEAMNLEQKEVYWQKAKALLRQVATVK